MGSGLLWQILNKPGGLEQHTPMSVAWRAGRSGLGDAGLQLAGPGPCCLCIQAGPGVPETLVVCSPSAFPDLRGAEPPGLGPAPTQHTFILTSDSRKGPWLWGCEAPGNAEHSVHCLAQCPTGAVLCSPFPAFNLSSRPVPDLPARAWLCPGLALPHDSWSWGNAPRS